MCQRCIVCLKQCKGVDETPTQEYYHEAAEHLAPCYPTSIWRRSRVGEIFTLTQPVLFFSFNVVHQLLHCAALEIWRCHRVVIRARLASLYILAFVFANYKFKNLTNLC